MLGPIRRSFLIFTMPLCGPDFLSGVLWWPNLSFIGAREPDL